MRSFLPTLLKSPLLSHLPLEALGTGSSCLAFTPDSQRLLLGLAQSGQVVVLELPAGDEGGEVVVVKCFTLQEAMVNGRVVKGRKKRRSTAREHEATMSQTGNLQPNGHAVAGDEDLIMPSEEGLSLPNGLIKTAEGAESVSTNGQNHNGALDMRTDEQVRRASAANGHDLAVPNGKAGHGGVDADQSSDQDDQDAEDSILPALVHSSDPGGAWISIMAASDDGQWLVLCDTFGRTSVYNLDTLQVRTDFTVSVVSLTPYSCMLPFLPSRHHLPRCFLLILTRLYSRFFFPRTIFPFTRSSTAVSYRQLNRSRPSTSPSDPSILQCNRPASNLVDRIRGQQKL